MTRIALGIIWFTRGTSVLSAWWTILSVFSGGMLGLFLIGAYARRTRPSHALLAVAVGFLLTLWVTVGQKALPLPVALHPNLSIVLTTLSIVIIGFALGAIAKAGGDSKRTTARGRGGGLRPMSGFDILTDNLPRKAYS